LLARKPTPESARETGDDEHHEPSVEVADSLVEEASDPNSTAIKPNPLNAPRKPGVPPSGSRPPVKPPLPRK
jgi:hypothetical protein